MDHTFLIITKIPVVGAKTTEEDAENASDGGGLRRNVSGLGGVRVGVGVGLITLHMSGAPFLMR